MTAKKEKCFKRSLCVQCGPDVPVCEEGCCVTCGADAIGEHADAVLNANTVALNAIEDALKWEHHSNAISKLLEEAAKTLRAAGGQG